MKYFFVAVVLLIATIAPAWADKAEIQKTIQSQINAFQEDDFEVAFEFASPKHCLKQSTTITIITTTTVTVTVTTTTTTSTTSTTGTTSTTSTTSYYCYCYYYYYY